MSSNLSLVQLKRAVELKEQILGLEAELSAVLDPNDARPTGGDGMSAATKAKLSAAAKARWAKLKSSGNGSAAKAGGKKMSAASKARISAAMKKRWAARKSAAANSGAVPKKAGKISAAARKKMSDAAKARWVKIKGGTS